MAKPGTLPRFAETGGGAAAVNITAPSSGQSDTGWVLNQVPTSANMNWIHYWTLKWCQYLNNLEAEALTFTAGVTFVGVTSTPGLSASAAAHASGIGGLFVSTSTAGSIGLKATVNNATGYAIKAETQTANGTAALITSTAGASTLTNGLSVNGVYGGAAVLASTTKAASSGTATYAINASIGASATATTAIDAALFGWGGTGIGTGVYGLAGTTGAGYGVKGEGVSSTSYGVYGLGGSGTAGGLAGYFVGGGGTTSTAGTGLVVVGGNASSTGGAGTALTVQPGTSVGGAAANAITTTNAAAKNATDDAFGLYLAADHEIKFAGTRTAYLYNSDLPNVVSAGTIVNARAYFSLTSGVVGILGGHNISNVTISTTEITVTFTGNFKNTLYSPMCSSGSRVYGIAYKTKAVGSCTFELYDTATGSLINPNSPPSNVFDIAIIGEMDP